MRPPDAFLDSRDRLDTASIRSTSDAALTELRPALEALGFEVEAGKKKIEKIRRPVLFGEQGHAHRVRRVLRAADWPIFTLRLRCGRRSCAGRSPYSASGSGWVSSWYPSRTEQGLSAVVTGVGEAPG